MCNINALQKVNSKFILNTCLSTRITTKTVIHKSQIYYLLCIKTQHRKFRIHLLLRNVKIL